MSNLFTIKKMDTYSVIRFEAMANPCEILIDCLDKKVLSDVAKLCLAETQRIEGKYSRYRKGNICHRLNTARGKPTKIDEETYKLLSFADQCYQMSDGLFDISSGILRQVWLFDGSSKLPNQKDIDDLLPSIAWEKISLNNEYLIMPAGMELDFGGIAKEYAVSRVAQLCLKHAPLHSALVNFGGDIEINQKRKDGLAWKVGIADANNEKTLHQFELKQGGLATSGDTNRYLLKDGVRYSHILNPKTGWPVVGAPNSVTVAAETCIQAGCLATIALLQGGEANAFLEAQGLDYYVNSKPS